MNNYQTTRKSPTFSTVLPVIMTTALLGSSVVLPRDTSETYTSVHSSGGNSYAIFNKGISSTYDSHTGTTARYPVSTDMV